MFTSTHTSKTMNTTTDLTVEQLVGDITGTLVKSINIVLEPLVSKINKNNQRDTVINEWLTQLPEYQLILLENKRLQQENMMYKNEPRVTMHIKEKPPTHVVSDVESIPKPEGVMRTRLEELRLMFHTFADITGHHNSQHYDIIMKLQQEYNDICNDLLCDDPSSVIEKKTVLIHPQSADIDIEASSDNEGSITDSSVTTISKKEPSEKEPSEKEPSEKEPSEKEPSEKEPSEKEPSEKEPSEIASSEEEEEEEEEEVEVEVEEEELFVVEMEDEDGNMVEYLTNDDQNGDIFMVDKDDEVGKKIGKFVNGDPELFE